MLVSLHRAPIIRHCQACLRWPQTPSSLVPPGRWKFRYLGLSRDCNQELGAGLGKEVFDHSPGSGFLRPWVTDAFPRAPGAVPVHPSAPRNLSAGWGYFGSQASVYSWPETTSPPPGVLMQPRK